MLVKMMSLPAPHVNNLAQEMRKGRERLEMANSGAAGTGDIKTFLSLSDLSDQQLSEEQTRAMLYDSNAKI
jgi:hypothetical protein